MTVAEMLTTMRDLGLDAQTKDFGISGWVCDFWVNGKRKSSRGGSEADAVTTAWEWLQKNPIEPDDWGPS